MIITTGLLGRQRRARDDALRVRAAVAVRAVEDGLARPEALGPRLWGEAVPKTPVSDRKWTQYIGVALDLIQHDPSIARLAAEQVQQRTEHFYRTMPPRAFVAVRRGRDAGDGASLDLRDVLWNVNYGQGASLEAA